MIALHPPAHPEQPFLLNPDVIVVVQGGVETVVVLTTGERISIAEGPEEVRLAVREWRVAVLSVALRELPRHSAGLALVRGGAADALRP